MLGRVELPVVLDQVRPYLLRVEKPLELDSGQLAYLLLGVVPAALFLDTLTDLLHDPLDIDGVRLDVELGHHVSVVSSSLPKDPPVALPHAASWGNGTHEAPGL